MYQDNNSMQAYFSGEKLYGDDFMPRQIEQWFEREREAHTERPHVMELILEF